MKYELKVITDISCASKSGKITVIKRNDKVVKLFELNDIKAEEYIDPKTGRHISKYSLIYDGDNCYKVDKPYKELRDLITNKSIPVLGLLSKSKRYKNGY